MCGIAGFAGRFGQDLLETMNDLIAHRGPDDAGLLILDGNGGRVGLAQRRLSIIDLSTEGHQPMTVGCRCCSPDGDKEAHEGLWLIFNGEIYNYRELREELVSKGHRFRSQTDSEVLLHLYAEYGPDMLKRLNGIFAFVIYDGRPNGQLHGMQPGDLLIVRDGLGVKPLYYAETPKGLVFGSELKSLIACEDVRRDLDPVAIHHYLTYLWAPAPRTPLTGVKKMKSGEAFVVRQGAIAKRWTYYDLPYGQEAFQGTEEEAASQLVERLSQAVERQMVADVPVGAFLSGGLDSSAIVAMMRKQRPDEQITCYTIAFNGQTNTEGIPADLPYARRVAKHLNVNLHEVEAGPEMIRHLQSMLWHLDEPQADPAPINAMLISQQARRDGVKVLMSGAGGDDIFSGYRRHLAQHMERFWSWMPRAARSAAAFPARQIARGMGPAGIVRTAFGRRLVKLLSHMDLPEDERIASYFYWSTEELRRSLYSKEMSTALEGVHTAAPLLESLGRIPGEREPLNRMLYLEAKHFLTDHNLNYTDKTSMAYGVEVRVPLLDPDLINFATRVPVNMKQKGRTGKAIFKQAMEPYLPHEVIYRPKSGFGAPLRRWLHNELRDIVADVLSVDSLHRRGVFDPAAVQRLMEWDRTGRVDGAYTIFSIICIELWCRMFLDGRRPQDSLNQTGLARY